LQLTDAPGRSLEAAEFRRGPGGRPTREEAERRHRALLDAASALFLEGGLNGTSIEAIAERAGVAKRFIYARYADKSELFVAAIGRFVEEKLSPLRNFEVPEIPVEAALQEFGRKLLALALSPEPLLSSSSVNASGPSAGSCICSRPMPSAARSCSTTRR
jgi:AcrR family transcriptional regulator